MARSTFLASLLFLLLLFTLPSFPRLLLDDELPLYSFEIKREPSQGEGGKPSKPEGNEIIMRASLPSFPSSLPTSSSVVSALKASDSKARLPDPPKREPNLMNLEREAQFSCHLPQVLEEAEVHPEDLQMTDLAQSLVDFFSGIKSTFHITVGWWTYQFTFNEEIRQYHQEANGGKTLEFLLGQYSMEGGEGEGGEGGEGARKEPGKGGAKVDLLDLIDKEMQKTEEEKRLEREQKDAEHLSKLLSSPLKLETELTQKGKKVFYLSQNYSSGDLCDLTNQGRSVEVRYRCNPSSYGIYAISEVATCRYVMTFFSHLLCQFPGFGGEGEKPHDIVCRTFQNADYQNYWDQKVNELMTPPLQIGDKQYWNPYAFITKTTTNPLADLSGGTKSTTTTASHPSLLKNNDPNHVKSPQGQQSPISPQKGKKEEGAQDLLWREEMKRKGQEALKVSNDVLKEAVAKFVGEKLKEKCFTGTFTAYWTYQFCFQDDIIQFHQEKDGKTTWEIELGNYFGKQKDSLTFDPLSLPASFSLRQLYDQGSICHELKKNRQVTLSLECLPEPNIPSSFGKYQMHLKEASLCVYELTFKTPFMCPHYWSFLELGEEEEGKQKEEPKEKEEELIKEERGVPKETPKEKDEKEQVKDQKEKDQKEKLTEQKGKEKENPKDVEAREKGL